MDNENIKRLTTVPATDINFISHLRMDTDEEIEWAIIKTVRKKGNISRVKVLKRELRKRARERDKK